MLTSRFSQTFVALSLLTIALGTRSAHSQPFTIRTVGTVGARPYGVAIGDLDGDGDRDLATANFGSNDVSLLLRQPDGTYAVQLVATVGTNPSGVALGDLDGDGNLDLAVTNSGSNDVTLLFRQPGGSYTSQSVGPVATTPRPIRIADLDGDGDLDLVVAGGGSGVVSLLLRQPGGSYTVQDVTTSQSGHQDLIVADLDGDGDLDFATANVNTNDISLLLRQPGGSYTEQTAGTVTSYPTGIAVGDLDGDGDPDLATPGYSSSTVGLLFRQPGGTYTAQSAGPVGVTPIHLVTGDLNGDGRLDIATTNSKGSNVSLLLRQADGTYQIESAGPIGGESRLIAIGDLDGDGDLDLATANSAPGVNTVSLLFNERPVDTPLSVELVSFTGIGEPNSVGLRWETASERENAGFTVVRDGVEIASFRTDDRLRGNGTTALRSAYSFTDRRVAPDGTYTYRLRSVDVGGQVHDLGGPVTVHVRPTVESMPLPTAFALHPASPNPFNPTTTVQLDLPESARVSMTLFDALGRPVRSLLTNATLSAGPQPVTLSANGLASGLYLIRVAATGASGRPFTATQRVLLVR